MYSRILKIALVCAVALFSTLVVFNNVTDYNSNFQFVKHVLLMDTTFPDNEGMWRSIESNWVHHTGYIFIILIETLVALTCWLGAIRLWRKKDQASSFNHAKELASAGLVGGILLWFVGFIVMGGEWFLMWQSDTWNGQAAASRFVTILGIVLIYLNMPDYKQVVLEEGENK